jgi:hypothetical protein
MQPNTLRMQQQRSSSTLHMLQQHTARAPACTAHAAAAAAAQLATCAGGAGRKEALPESEQSLAASSKAYAHLISCLACSTEWASVACTWHNTMSCTAYWGPASWPCQAAYAMGICQACLLASALMDAGSSPDDDQWRELGA